MASWLVRSTPDLAARVQDTLIIKNIMSVGWEYSSKQMNYISCTFKFNWVGSSKKTNVEVNSNTKSCIKLIKFLLNVNNDHVETFL